MAHTADRAALVALAVAVVATLHCIKCRRDSAPRVTLATRRDVAFPSTTTPAPVASKGGRCGCCGDGSTLALAPVPPIFPSAPTPTPTNGTTSGVTGGSPYSGGGVATAEQSGFELLY